MKTLRGIITTLWICIGLTSCIQDEPLCPEAEIESFTLPSELLFSDPVINQGQNTIQVLLNKKADLTALAPEVTVNEFSTVSPASGETVDFTNPVTYRVTAQDGIHTRDYKVQMIVMDDEDVYTSLMKNFEFSYWEENSSFHYATPVQKTNDVLHTVSSQPVIRVLPCTSNFRYRNSILHTQSNTTMVLPPR